MADEAARIDWPTEEIPDEDLLYYRVHRQGCDERADFRPEAFRDQADSMSTDWSKYSTPAESRARARKPEDNGIVSLRAGGVRAIATLRVEHRPDSIRRNRAHTDVFGKKSVEVRVKLRRLALEGGGWTISPAAATT